MNSEKVKALRCTWPMQAQEVHLMPSVVKKLQRWRQLDKYHTEAGGQLFGDVEDTAVVVRSASGPYRNDFRARHHYQSTPKSAQRAIWWRSKLGQLYLGEWHTHAEKFPSPSAQDHQAMLSIFSDSQLNTNAILLLIQGMEPGPSGLGVYWFNGSLVGPWPSQEFE